MASRKPFHLTIARVDTELLKGEVYAVTLPAEDGEMTILANHEPYIAPLRAGTITVQNEQGSQDFEIEGGFVEVSDNRAIVLL